MLASKASRERAGQMNPNSFDYARYLIDQLFPTLVVFLVCMIPLAIASGLRLASYLINYIQKAIMAMPTELTDKPKREPPVSFFEAPDTEPDYVVGFGDDGELVYASEKPKRKNDEVD